MKNQSYHGGFSFGKNRHGLHYNHKEALSFFLQNLKECKILTDSSISCITLLLTIDDTNVSSNENYPYLSNRYAEFNKPIKKILLKLFLASNIDGQIIFNNTIKEETSDQTLLKEANTQLNIYKEGFMRDENAFDPICPAILNCTKKISDGDKRWLKNIVLNPSIFKNRRKGTVELDDLSLLEQYFTHDISLICMEYLNGYKILAELCQDPRFQFFKTLAFFELMKLYEYGYVHNDFHMGNVMINPDYMYLTDDPAKSKLFGRAIIIDFGRTDLHGRQFRNKTEQIKYIRTTEHQIVNPCSSWYIDFTSANIPNIISKLDEYTDLRRVMENHFYSKLLSTGLTQAEIKQKNREIVSSLIVAGGVSKKMDIKPLKSPIFLNSSKFNKKSFRSNSKSFRGKLRSTLKSSRK